MSETPIQPPPPLVSPDAKYYWDGERWIPMPQPPQPVVGPVAPSSQPGGSPWGRTAAVAFITLIVGGVAGFAIGSGSHPSSSGPTGSAQASPSTQASTATVPSPAPRQVVTFSGTGSKVTDPFHLQTGNYRVTWTASGGTDNFIVHINLGSQSQGLVNEIPPNPSSGEALFAAPQDGAYFLEVKTSTLTWTITFTPF